MKIVVMGILIIGLSLLGAREYVIDKSQSKVGFEGSKFLAVSVEGKFLEYEGKINIQDDVIHTLEGKVVVDSIESGNTTRDEHIRGKSLIESQKFPYITFAMKEYKQLTENGEVIGILEIHGIAKEVRLTSTLKHTQNGYTLYLNGKIDVKKDFGMESYTIMNNSIKIDVVLALQ
ncbi:YceI family protein [Helicobacter equorum]|uniref:YceI family protein n=1 Tax=Helicobacter equorum TaxID=361872 RepID=UPI000CF12170|nr:YceI family protein [Helicobacter equorum]